AGDVAIEAEFTIQSAVEEGLSFSFPIDGKPFEIIFSPSKGGGVGLRKGRPYSGEKFAVGQRCVVTIKAANYDNGPAIFATLNNHNCVEWEGELADSSPRTPARAAGDQKALRVWTDGARVP